MCEPSIGEAQACIVCYRTQIVESSHKHHVLIAKCSANESNVVHVMIGLVSSSRVYTLADRQRPPTIITSGKS